MKELTLRKVIFTSLILFIAFSITSCGSDTDTSSDDNTPSTPTEHTEYVTAYADRPLRTAIKNVPFEIDWGHITTKSHDIVTTMGARTDLLEDSNEFFFIASNGYTGTRTITFELHDEADEHYVLQSQRPAFYKTYIINVVPPPLEGNRDFMLSYQCDHEADGVAAEIEINIANNDLSLRQELYQKTVFSQSGSTVPSYYSRIEIDYLGQDYQDAVSHHNTFKNNLDGQLLITCKYNGGNKSFIYPINSSDWYASQFNRGNGNSRSFIRNDIYIYISSLSDLHARIYKKNIDAGSVSTSAYQKANEFMENNFPSGNYSIIFAEDHDSDPEHLFFYNESGIGDENIKYYGSLELMSEELGIGSVFMLVEEISNAYEAYYLKGPSSCINESICAAFFPEHTTSVTNNPQFEGDLHQWSVDKTTSATAFGGIKASDLDDTVMLELRGNVTSNDIVSSLEVYQEAPLLSSHSIDDYYLYADLKKLVGTSTGFSLTKCINSSGLTGIFASLHDANGNQIGLLTWTDHCNKFDAAWVSGNIFDSNNVFHNTRMREVIRRFVDTSLEFTFTASIGELLKNHLPDVYAVRSSIASIRYGAFATEHRSPSNTCYYCYSELEANEINLLRKN